MDLFSFVSNEIMMDGTEISSFSYVKRKSSEEWYVTISDVTTEKFILSFNIISDSFIEISVIDFSKNSEMRNKAFRISNNLFHFRNYFMKNPLFRLKITTDSSFLRFVGLVEPIKSLEVALREFLSEKEIMVLSFRYGLFDESVKTLDEIGSIFGVTRDRVKQIEAKALDKLRNVDFDFNKIN